MSLTRTATLFGGTGFLGRAIVQALAQNGWLVRVPTRHPDRAATLRLAGLPGQIVPLPCSFYQDAGLAEAIDHSDAVINLIGILAERGAATFQNIHVALAARIARVAKEQGAESLLHVSALGANATSSSRYASSKALGEDAVRAFFPEAIIFRPGVLFGPGDGFLNRFANMARFSPFLPLIGGGKTRFQPVYVGDVAKTAMAMLSDYTARGQTLELGGPEIYTLRAMLQLMLKTTGKKRWLIPVPWGIAKILAAFMELLPNPPLTRDQVELLKTDNIIRSPQDKKLCRTAIRSTTLIKKYLET